MSKAIWALVCHNKFNAHCYVFFMDIEGVKKEFYCVQNIVFRMANRRLVGELTAVWGRPGILAFAHN